MKKYKLLTDRFEHKKGTIVYDQSGYYYGLSSDDTNVTGIEHISVTLNKNGDYPGFTVSVEDLKEVILV